MGSVTFQMQKGVACFKYRGVMFHTLPCTEQAALRWCETFQRATNLAEAHTRADAQRVLRAALETIQ